MIDLFDFFNSRTWKRPKKEFYTKIQYYYLLLLQIVLNDVLTPKDSHKNSICQTQSVKYTLFR